MAVNARNIVIQEAQAGGSQVGKPGLQSKTLSKRKGEGANTCFSIKQYPQSYKNATQILVFLLAKSLLVGFLYTAQPKLTGYESLSIFC